MPTPSELKSSPPQLTLLDEVVVGALSVGAVFAVSLLTFVGLTASLVVLIMWSVMRTLILSVARRVVDPGTPHPCSSRQTSLKRK